MTWMEEVKRLPGEKDVINYFDIDTEKLTKTNQQKQELDGPRDRWSTKILVEKASSGPKSLAGCIQEDNL